MRRRGRGRAEAGDVEEVEPGVRRHHHAVAQRRRKVAGAHRGEGRCERGDHHQAVVHQERRRLQDAVAVLSTRVQERR